MRYRKQGIYHKQRTVAVRRSMFAVSNLLNEKVCMHMCITINTPHEPTFLGIADLETMTLADIEPI